jgi:hypothetical protein
MSVGGFAAVLGAVGAAVDCAVGLDAMADHAAIAVLAARREGVDRALETVERVVVTVENDLEGLFVFVSANFAACHDFSPLTRCL